MISGMRVLLELIATSLSLGLNEWMACPPVGGEGRGGGGTDRRHPLVRDTIVGHPLVGWWQVNILLRDTINRLFADRILMMVKRDIAALKPENMELASEEIRLVLER